MTTEPPIVPNLKDRPVVAMLWRTAGESPIYQPWLSCPPDDIEIRVLGDYDAAQELADEIDLLVTHNHYRWDELAMLRQAMSKNDRGVLVLADGITEFRNSWQNPLTPAGSLMQPALAHKIATIGAAQARLWESWGNWGRCETVGLPRLDQRAQDFGWWSKSYPATLSIRDRNDATLSPTLLICSARTPAFSEAQWDVVLEQFASLRQSLAVCPPLVGDRPVRVCWRVADRIRDHLQLAPEQCSAGDLTTAIDHAIAVITTPSTLQLEAMLAHRPVAILDFFNVPLYVPSGWLISAPSQVNATVSELLNPTAERLFYQQSLLVDQLSCESSATERMWTLIRSMAHIARRHRRAGQMVRFPEQILTTCSTQHSKAVNWATLLPERQRWAEIARTEDRSVWELTEVVAALVRAREYSEERRQLHYLTGVHHRAVQTYEAVIEEKCRIIEQSREYLAEIQDRLRGLNELLNRRNADFLALNQRIADLVAEKLKAHEQLSEANAEGKRKQDRINELRTHYHQIRESHAKLKAKLEAINQTPSPTNPQQL